MINNINFTKENFDEPDWNLDEKLDYTEGYFEGDDSNIGLEEWTEYKNCNNKEDNCEALKLDLKATDTSSSNSVSDGDGEVSNPIVTITNKSSIDVEIYDVFNKDPKGRLTYTLLGKLVKGQTTKITTIHFASQLQAMYTGTIQAFNNMYYCQFPIAVFAVTGLEDNYTFSFDDSNKESMEKSFDFIKFITSEPNTEIANNFTTAFNSENQDQDVNKFFTDNSGWEKCTIDSWSAIASWQAQFTSAWQGSYYVYTQTDPNGDKGTKLKGYIDISDKEINSAVYYLANNDGSKSDTKITLLMKGDGYLIQDNSASSPTEVKLQPSWVDTLELNSVENSDKGIRESILLGTIGNNKVLATQDKIEDSSSSTSSSNWWDLASSIANTIANVTGQCINMAMLVIMFKQYRNEKTQKVDDVVNKDSNPKGNKEKLQAEQKKVESEYAKENLPENNKQIKSAQDAMVNHSEDMKKLSGYRQLEKLNNNLESQEKELHDVLQKIPPSSDTENCAKELKNIKNTVKEKMDKIANGTVKVEDLNVDECVTSISKISESIKNISSTENVDKSYKERLEKVRSEFQEKCNEIKSIKEEAERAKEQPGEKPKPGENPEPKPEKPTGEHPMEPVKPHIVIK